MAARAVSSGSLTFGPVCVPVKLYTAAQTEGVSMSFITPASAARGGAVKAKFPCVDPETGDELSRSACLKGYEYQKGQYVVFTQQEVKSLESEKSACIDIKEFVEAASVDLVQVEKSYYLKPDKGGDKGYKLIAGAMQGTGLVAVATWTSRGKEHLVAVRPYRGGLILHQLYYTNEVRDFEDNCAVIPINEMEVKVAAQLVSQYSTGAFDASKYHDTYVDRVVEAANQKLAGGEITIATQSPAGGGDMLAAMQAMLAAGAPAPAAPEVATGDELSAMLSSLKNSAPVPAAPAKKARKKAAKKASKKSK